MTEHNLLLMINAGKNSIATKIAINHFYLDKDLIWKKLH